MNYKKCDSNISFKDFTQLVSPLSSFRSLTGKEYIITSLSDNKLFFIRVSSGKNWDLDLKQVHLAYKELSSFRTIDFKSYAPRRQSPALGLLIATGLLSQ